MSISKWDNSESSANRLKRHVRPNAVRLSRRAGAATAAKRGRSAGTLARSRSLDTEFAVLGKLFEEFGLKILKHVLDLLNFFSQGRKTDIATDFCEWRLQGCERGAIHFGYDLIPSIVWRNEIKRKVDIGLH
jgi:hypothetical protein